MDLNAAQSGDEATMGQAKRETEFKKELEPKFEASLRQVGIGA